MKAVSIINEGPDYRLALTSQPIPVAGENEILIHVKACGVNRGDVLQASGLYPPPLNASHLLGLEVSGYIVALGRNVQHFSLDDKVCALVEGGGYAEFVVAHKNTILPLPRNFSFEEGASIMESAFTCLHHVHMLAKCKTNDIMLLHGGSGGLGSFIIQWTKIHNITLYTTVSTEEKKQFCLSLGATLVINHQKDDFMEVVKHHTKRKNVDIILDPLGGPFVQKHLQLLAVGGRLVFLSFLQGAKTEITLGPVLVKKLQILGGTLRRTSLIEKTRIAKKLYKECWPLLENKKIRPIIDKIFPIEKAFEAHNYIKSRQHKGKLILKM